MTQLHIPILTSKAFWDVDLNALNFEKQKAAIIRRVFNDGAWNDIIEILNYYGEEVIIESLVSANYLKKAAVNLASMMFNLAPEKFICYTKIQYQKIL